MGSTRATLTHLFSPQGLTRFFIFNRLSRFFFFFLYAYDLFKLKEGSFRSIIDVQPLISSLHSSAFFPETNLSALLRDCVCAFIKHGALSRIFFFMIISCSGLVMKKKKTKLSNCRASKGKFGNGSFRTQVMSLVIFIWLWRLIIKNKNKLLQYLPTDKIE